MTKIPLTGTYRVQFTREFTFADAERLVPYWKNLGVSHLYASPIFRARTGSQHGYDVVDHDAVNPELGGIEGLRRLSAALKGAGMGLIADIVPNHAGVGGTGNARWQDVLEFGRRSRNARFFDIDWGSGPLILPILDGTLEEVAEAGRFGLLPDRKSGRVYLTFEDHRLPLRPETIGRLIRDAAAATGRDDLAVIGDQWAELESIRAATSGRRARREALSEALADDTVLQAVRAAAEPSRMAQIAGSQHYLLMHWREGAERINYRRFFDVNELAGLRVEEPVVFDAVHRLPLALIREGILDGLRVDHIDGLADPAAYCRRLREAVGPDVTLHVEKILGEDEPLPDWPVEGTTGYETLNLVNGLFVDPVGYDLLARDAAANGIEGSVEERIRSAKAEILERSFSAELDVLSRLGADLCRHRGHPVRLRTMREILTGLIAALPVYRTYVTDTAGDRDRAYLQAAVEAARPDLRRGGKRALSFLVQVILEGARDEESRGFIRRFQQLSGPAMAKGYEDTELYRNVALASVNEVGSHLARPYLSPEVFHKTLQATAARGLTSLTPLSTHDTKRGADTRARLNVLSEIAETWLQLAHRWRARHADLRRPLPRGGMAPDAADESLVYQTLFGVWPVSADRVREYLTKALREAKRHTTWIDQNEAYEAATLDFATALVEGEAGAPFRRELQDLLATADEAGRRNSLAQTALQLTIPGVPDVYRGSEFYEYVLVDPDNRRPVDFEIRQAALETKGPEDDPPGRAKQHLIATLLGVRRTYPDVFLKGDYAPLPVMGADDVIAFARRYDGESLVVVVPVRGAGPTAGTVVVDVGSLPQARWRPIVGAREIRAEGRLLRIGRSSLSAVVISIAHD
ncbi:malto-oligosyltrehalose synthase [Chthonobacter rhizosphaerae]|uniref:malto-oligosyltrehalose synthase n=1 Tax=Chthonobacter rhizosphaerae TaxID=2735553 RepID=UPI0015EF68A1|nr:malto-oligosyltrehalose synthase [Chthonobacter rhizosphaerae]